MITKMPAPTLVRHEVNNSVLRFWLNREDALVEAKRISSECEVVRTPQLVGWWILRHSEPYLTGYDHSGRLPVQALTDLFEMGVTSKP